VQWDDRVDERAAVKKIVSVDLASSNDKASHLEADKLPKEKQNGQSAPFVLLLDSALKPELEENNAFVTDSQ
jgi:hypothetical protein